MFITSVPVCECLFGRSYREISFLFKYLGCRSFSVRLKTLPLCGWCSWLYHMLSFFNLAVFWVLSVMRLTGEALTAMASNSTLG